MELSKLQNLPESVSLSLSQLDGIDRCFQNGFSRLTEAQKEALNSFTNIFSQTQFEKPLTDAVDSIVRGNFQVDAFKTIAGARQALAGALYDALQNHLGALSKRVYISPENIQFKEESSPLLDSCSEWLKEIAICGYESLDHAQLQPFTQTLENLMKERHFYRQSSLLTGFLNELSQSIPVSTMNTIPLRRWGDLWSRAMINATRVIDTQAKESASGELFILGTDIHQHSNCVSLKCYGILTGDTSRFVNFTITSFKVDTIVSQENWKLFTEFPIFLEALSKNRAVQIDSLPLINGNTLLWDESKATLSAEFDPLAKVSEELESAEFYRVPAYDRHYVHLAEPIYLSDYKITLNEDEIELSAEGTSLKIDAKRLPSMSIINGKMLKDSKECFGLLRFDNGEWLFQPLTIKTVIKKAEYIIHNGSSAIEMPAKIAKKKKTSNSFEILKERSSRLLRG